jgi:hypothetical protein
MKHHSSGRPIGKCKGCCLNLKRICAAGLDPKSQWKKGRCRDFGDSRMLEAFLHPAAPTGAKAARLQRKARALVGGTQPHHDGQLFVPVRLNGMVAARR